MREFTITNEEAKELEVFAKEKATKTTIDSNLNVLCSIPALKTDYMFEYENEVLIRINVKNTLTSETHILLVEKEEKQVTVYNQVMTYSTEEDKKLIRTFVRSSKLYIMDKISMNELAIDYKALLDKGICDYMDATLESIADIKYNYPEL